MARMLSLSQHSPLSPGSENLLLATFVPVSTLFPSVSTQMGPSIPPYPAVAQAASDSPGSSCLGLPSSGTTDVYHHTWLAVFTCSNSGPQPSVSLSVPWLLCALSVPCCRPNVTVLE